MTLQKPPLVNQVFSAEQIKKLTAVITDGINVLEEVDSLKEGLKDTLNAVAEEMEIRVAVLNKAVKAARRNNYSDLENEVAEIENILKATNRL